ncbi:MAG: hypothetical protein HKN14_00280 [Marinicaulis sp.]|nr:hypothetical protein [Marinicaulis sp.]
MRAVRIVLIILAITAVLAGALYLVRLPAAGFAVRSVMAARGLEQPTARVTALSLNRMFIEDLAVAAPGGDGFEFKSIDVGFNIREALSDRRVEQIKIDGGVLRVAFSEDGGVKVRGLESFIAGEPGPLPFDAFALNSLIIIETPKGIAQGNLDTVYHADAGGEASIVIEMAEAGANAVTLGGASSSFQVDLEHDGVFSITGNVDAQSIRTNVGIVKNAVFEFAGDGSSWRELVAGKRENLTASGSFAISNAEAVIADSPQAERLMQRRGVLLFGGPMSRLNFSGDIVFEYGPDGISAMFGDTPLAARADTGAELVLAEQFDTPLVEKVGGGAALAFAYTIKGGEIEAVGSVNLETAGEGWYAFAPVRVREYQSEALAFRNASASIQVNGNGQTIEAELTTTIDLQSAKIGRLSIIDAPFTTKFLVTADRNEKIIDVTIPDDQCIGLERARIVIAQQDMDASLQNGRLCVDDRPLNRTDWNGDLLSNFNAQLTADRARYRLGQTRLVGRPPRLDLSGEYRPAERTTTVNGNMQGGSFVLNNTLRLTGASGAFELILNAAALNATTNIRDVEITQNLETPLVAPVFADFRAELARREIAFSYDLRSEDGIPLGSGTGEHAINSGRGRSILTFDGLEFKTDGLQPDKLAPVLKGVIGATGGKATGKATFSWMPGTTNSSADFSFDDITFEGPTRVVNSTRNLNGDISFTSLWPATTDGAQTITVEGVDLDALQLNEGSIEFDLPGDQTLRINEATFPWFGGVLGVYGANASIAGDQAIAPMRAEKIDLAQILEFVDVEGLSGEGILSGTLPLVVENGRARIENGVLKSESPGAIRYRGEAADKASDAGGDQTKIAFDILRNLEYDSLGVLINGPLDGRLDFELKFEGRGDVNLNNQQVRVPVIYRINLDAALLELFNQANLSRNIQLQVERAIQGNQR